ncbi:MAG TPA: MFS transporter [Actinomycetota bacterium]|nr:MFS transporter [Actinomycetota bacterium]
MGRRKTLFTAWLHPATIAPALLAVAAGFAQFVATASLADVADAFGVSGVGNDEPGLTGTALGVGLAVIRAGSLAALFLTSRADRSGRRRLALVCVVTGLLLTAAAALAPTFWWFVLILAIARPLLTATNAIAVVVAAEVTKTSQRSRAVALVGAAYGLGAGLTVLLRSASGDLFGFRGLFLVAALPILAVVFVARRLQETPSFQDLSMETRNAHRLFGPVAVEYRMHLVILCVLTASAAFVSAPVTTFVFYFAETFRGLDPAIMAYAVLAAAPIGLVGLLAGRWAADNLGRRISCAVSQAAVAAGAIVTYNAPGLGVVIGYLAAIFAASVYTPGSGAICAELFPTSYRSSAAGWITTSGVLGAVLGLGLFGFLADRFGNYDAASVWIAAPVLLLSLLYLRLPETKGKELPDTVPGPGQLPI